MTRIRNKALPDDEGTLLMEDQDPQSALDTMMQRFIDRNCTVVEESPGKYTVNEANGQFIGIFYIED